MFDLDQAVAEWRRQMLAAGIKTPVPLDELESHLRDDVGQQVQSGSDAQQAFKIAAERIGEADALKTEFAKARLAPKAPRRLFGFACFVLIGFILWMGGYTFSQLEFGMREQIVAYAGVSFTLVTACTWRYAVPFLPLISNMKRRMTVGSACVLSGFLFTSFFCNVILPHFEHNHDGQIPALGFWAVLPIAVFLSLGVGLMMSDRERGLGGMERPSGRRTAPVIHKESSEA